MSVVIGPITMKVFRRNHQEDSMFQCSALFRQKRRRKRAQFCINIYEADLKTEIITSIKGIHHTERNHCGFHFSLRYDSKKDFFPPSNYIEVASLPAGFPLRPSGEAFGFLILVCPAYCCCLSQKTYLISSGLLTCMCYCLVTFLIPFSVCFHMMIFGIVRPNGMYDRPTAI